MIQPPYGRDRVVLNDAVEMVRPPVIEAGGFCEHLMALHLDLHGDDRLGVVRCIESRAGEVHAGDFIDRSEIHRVTMPTPYRATIGPIVEMAGADERVDELPDHPRADFLGFEDPNLWRSADGKLHLYCTIPFLRAEEPGFDMFLGHAVGPDIGSLGMTEPVLSPVAGEHAGAKEVAIAPEASDGRRRHLVESNDVVDGCGYSVVRSVVAADFTGPWEYGDLLLHPAHDGKPWCAGHVSPGPLLPKTFLNPGDGKLVGLLNGRAAARDADGSLVRTNSLGTFTVGLLVYDYEHGEVEWFSDEPLFADPDARTITFASAFRQTRPERGLLYAHVDDSYVRAYVVDAPALAAHLPDGVGD